MYKGEIILILWLMGNWKIWHLIDHTKCALFFGGFFWQIFHFFCFLFSCPNRKFDNKLFMHDTHVCWFSTIHIFTNVSTKAHTHTCVVIVAAIGECSICGLSPPSVPSFRYLNNNYQFFSWSACFILVDNYCTQFVCKFFFFCEKPTKFLVNINSAFRK